MSSLLDKSLDDIARQNRNGSKRSSLGGRGSPYGSYAKNKSTEENWKHDRFDGSGASAAPVTSDAKMDETDTQDLKPSRALVLKNLHYEVSERELEFDRSGRSTGIAYVKYINVKDAVNAKQMYDGRPAKGEKIEVSFDQRYVNMPVIQDDSLLKRVQGAMPALRSKLASERNPASKPKRERDAPTGSLRPQRSNLQDLPFHPKNLGARGIVPSRDASARGGRGRGRGRVSGPERGAAKTVDDLDKELEDFMNAPAPGEGGASIEADMSDVPATNVIDGSLLSQRKDLDAPDQTDVEMKY